MPIKRKYEKTATDDYQDKMTVRANFGRTVH